MEGGKRMIDTNKIKDGLIEFKFMMVRGYMWIQTFYVVLVATASLKILIPQIPSLYLGVLCFLGVITIGYFDKKWGLMEKDFDYSAKNTPTLMKGLFKGKEQQENETKIK